MGVAAGDVERDRVLVADVLGERLARVAVEHDDAGHALQAGEEVVLAALVVVEPADHAAARERDVRLHASASAAALSRRSSQNQPRSSSKRRSGIRTSPSTAVTCSTPVSLDRAARSPRGAASACPRPPTSPHPDDVAAPRAARSAG